MDIYFLDMKSLEVVKSHPFAKTEPKRSFLKNWEDIFLGLDLVKLVLSYRSSFDLHSVASDNFLISGLIKRLEKEVPKKALTVVLVSEVNILSK